MKLIPLTKGQFAKVDDADYERLSQWLWQATWDPHYQRYYATRNVYNGKPRGKGCQTPVRMHRVIMDAKRAQEVDHRNHDTLDNQRHNLRVTTTSKNHQNMRKSSVATSSRFKGVSWRTRERKWLAYITDHSRGYPQRRIGSFRNEEDAARAYDAEARRIFGEFACLNFPRPGEQGALSREAAA